jgi:hypothetical protein
MAIVAGSTVAGVRLLSPIIGRWVFFYDPHLESTVETGRAASA